MIRAHLLPLPPTADALLDLNLAMSTPMTATDFSFLKTRPYPEAVLYVLLSRLRSTRLASIIAALPVEDGASWTPLLDLVSRYVPIQPPDLSGVSITEDLLFTLQSPIFLSALANHIGLANTQVAQTYEAVRDSHASLHSTSQAQFAIQTLSQKIATYLLDAAPSRAATPSSQQTHWVLSNPHLWHDSLPQAVEAFLDRNKDVLLNRLPGITSYTRDQAGTAALLAIYSPHTSPQALSIAIRVLRRMARSDNPFNEHNLKALISHPSLDASVLKEACTRDMFQSLTPTIFLSLSGPRQEILFPYAPESVIHGFIDLALEIVTSAGTASIYLPEYLWPYMTAHQARRMIATRSPSSGMWQYFLDKHKYSGDIVKACLAAAVTPEQQADVLAKTVLDNPSEVAWILKRLPLLPGVPTRALASSLLVVKDLPKPALDVIRQRVLFHIGTLEVPQPPILPRQP